MLFGNVDGLIISFWLYLLLNIVEKFQLFEHCEKDLLIVERVRVDFSGLYILDDSLLNVWLLEVGLHLITETHFIITVKIIID